MRNLWIVFLALCIPVFCFSQQINVIGKVPPANSEGRYRLQVGAFRTSSPAVNAFERLKNGGIDPLYERYEDFRRVVVAGLKAGDIPQYIERIRIIGFLEVWVREDIPDERWKRVATPEVGNDDNYADAGSSFTDTDGSEEDYSDIHNIVINMVNQGVLRIRSRVNPEGNGKVDFTYTDSETGSVKSYSVDTPTSPDIEWVVDPAN